MTAPGGDLKIRKPHFVERERARQSTFFRATLPDECGFGGCDYRLPPDRRLSNLNPGIRDLADRYFSDKSIAWHRHAAHGLSSQACCLNFLMPLAGNPCRLSQMVGNALGIEPPVMLEVETGPGSKPWHVGFEWVGRDDHLREGRPGIPLQRGANSTSADAFVRFRAKGRTEGLLIEWKYTESYGQPLADRSRIRSGQTKPSGGHATRRARYERLMFADNGPLKPDAELSLDDFFYEPFYQLLRQQMLAHQMEDKGEADIVRVLHISPKGNRKLHAVTSPRFAERGATDAFDLFRSLLAKPDRFIARSTEDVFRDILDAAPIADPWACYIKERYAFVNDGDSN